MTDEQQKTSSFATSDRIHVVQIGITFWNGRRTFIKTVLLFAITGLLIALFSPKQYSASTTLVPQETNMQSRLGELSGLASMAGINFNMAASNEITPPVYPRIISSVPFQLELMETTLTFKEIGRPISLFEYYTKYDRPNPFIQYTIGLPGLLVRRVRKDPEKQSVQPDDPIQLTEEQRQVRKKLNKLVTIAYDEKDRYLTLTCRMPEALAAAQLARHTQELLQKYITEFKVEKALTRLTFIQQRYHEVQKQYNEAQEVLARFRDRNKNVSQAMAQTELDRLVNNLNLAFRIYSELAAQLEQAKIQVKEDTPVFTIIEPASVPFEKSKPKRTVILVVWIFMGSIAGAAIVFGRKYLTVWKSQWNREAQNHSL
ncbi:MAG: GNVR domain-containing protein [Mangrovibacterium sp.]